MLRASASRLTSLAFIVYLSSLASPALGQTIDITCEALEDNSIDWDCIFGPDSLEEVYDHGGELEACPTATERHPCSMFTVEKEEERAEVKVQEGPEGFMFLKGEHYVFRYSFRAKEGMAVGSDHTHLGQLKGAHNTDGGTRGGNMLSGDPIYGLVANNEGLMVRFSNKATIEDYHRGLEVPLNWETATGQWVHVKIDTTFGEHMEVELSGAVEGKAVWPENLPPIAWHNDAEKVRMKLGLYHEEDKVADGEVEYRSISIEGPNGVIRTREPTGSILRGCYQDGADRVLQRAKYVNGRMTAELCESLCEGSQYFGMQYGYECWCGGATSNLIKHGTSDACSVKCPGNSRQTCGGSWAISIYEYEGSPKVIPLESDYIGCFADFPTDRALTIKSTSTDQMSPQRCNRFCSWSNAKYYGVQYGRECFCGHETDRYDRHGPGICHIPCVGIPRLVCGGFNAMNVYRVE